MPITHRRQKKTRNMIRRPQPMSQTDILAHRQQKSALILSAAKVDSTTSRVPYWGIIPLERLNDPAGTMFYVRARVSPNIVADVEVTREARGFSIGSCRIAGREDGQYRLYKHSALAVMPHRGGRVQDRGLE